MPKPFLPPQGGEKWLCLGMFLTLMFSVICIVVAIYCIVIIYDPSVKEINSEISSDPKRCTTTLIERNITGTPEDQKCNWSSCEEWCLSKGASPCSKVRHGQQSSLLTLHYFIKYMAHLLPHRTGFYTDMNQF